MKGLGITEFILAFAIVLFTVLLFTQFIYPKVILLAGGEEEESTGSIGVDTGSGSVNWKFDIIEELTASTSYPRTASVGPYIFTSSLEMLGHSFGAQVRQYFNITNTICCECEPQDINNWQVCVIDGPCDQTPNQIQVVGPPGMDALSEEELYMVSAETGEDWICLRFRVAE